MAQKTTKNKKSTVKKTTNTKKTAKNTSSSVKRKSAKKTSSSGKIKSLVKTVTDKVKKVDKSTLIKVGIGAAIAGYAAYKAFKVYKAVTTKASFPIKFNNEEEASEFLFDPNVKGEWSGDPGLAQVFLKEYILKKYPNACTLKKIYMMVFNIQSGNIEIVEKKTENNSVLWGLLGGNPESIYVHMLYENDKAEAIFRDILEDSECKNKDFIIIPINLRNNNSVHANILLYNMKTKTIEHYEPYGSYLPESFYDNFFSFFKNSGITYKSPTHTCPSIGFQKASWDCPNVFFKFKTPYGYCLIWSLYLVELRLKNPDVIDTQKLIDTEVQRLKKNNSMELCKFIIGYTQFIMKFVEKFQLIKTDMGGAQITIDYS